MPTIASIRAGGNDAEWLSVRVGREVVARLSRASAQSLGLRAGMEWDEHLQQRVAALAEVDQAMRDARKILNRRALSGGELADRLRRKGISRGAADQVVQRLREGHWLDDERYAQAVVQREMARKPAGRRLLAAKLAAKRIDRTVADRVLTEAEQSTDAVADASRLIEKKLRNPSLRNCDARTRQRRLWGMLARRGFNGDTIAAAMARMKVDDQPEE